MRSTLNLDLHLLSPADWTLLRTVRLEALQESPHAFLSGLEIEQRLSESDWRQMFDAATWIVAREAERVIGLLRSVVDSRRPWVRYLESIWVVPTHRRHGVFRELLAELANFERDRGASDLLLWVLEDNYPARYAYMALGFEATGNRQPLADSTRHEIEFGLRLIRRPES